MEFFYNFKMNSSLPKIIEKPKNFDLRGCVSDWIEVPVRETGSRGLPGLSRGQFLPAWETTEFPIEKV